MPDDIATDIARLQAAQADLADKFTKLDTAMGKLAIGLQRVESDVAHVNNLLASAPVPAPAAPEPPAAPPTPAPAEEETPDAS